MRAGAVFVAFLAATVGVTTLAQQTPARDRQAEPMMGTGMISGSIVTDEAEPKPVRRARVTLNPDGGNGWTTVSDDDGRFTFAQLPAGRFELKAFRESYVPVVYGARRIGGTGTSIPVAAGQKISGITLRMPRGAVITGTIRDERGRPLSRAGVDVLRREVRNGRRTIVPFVTGQGTDDRGVFRIYGLPAGEYLVRANRLGSGIRQISAADIQRIRARAWPRPDDPVASRQSSPTPSAQGYVPVYFPGTVDPLSAAWLTVAAGEERAGVDIAMMLVPNARLQGTLAGPADVRVGDAQLSIVPVLQPTLAAPATGTSMSIRPDAQGRFVVAALASGTYVITARVNGPVVRPDTPGAQMTAGGRGMAGQAIAGVLTATETVVVQGADLDVNLALAPAPTVTVRLTFEGTTPPPSSLTGYRMTLKPTDVPTGDGLSVTQPDGTFLISGLRPGRFQLVPTLPPGSVWSVRAATMGDRDALDAPIVIEAGKDPAPVIVTMTDVVTEFTGVLQDATGRAATDYLVVVYARDQARWTPDSRWVTAVRPGTDGRYVVRGLPAGDYYVGAVTDAEPGEWFLPDFLDALVKASAPVSLALGRVTVQDLRIGSGGAR